MLWLSVVHPVASLDNPCGPLWQHSFLFQFLQVNCFILFCNLRVISVDMYIYIHRHYLCIYPYPVTLAVFLAIGSDGNCFRKECFLRDMVVI